MQWTCRNASHQLSLTSYIHPLELATSQSNLHPAPLHRLCHGPSPLQWGASTSARHRRSPRRQSAPLGESMGKCFMGQAGQMANVIHRTKTKSNDPERPVLNKPESVDLSDRLILNSSPKLLSTSPQRTKDSKTEKPSIGWMYFMTWWPMIVFQSWNQRKLNV